MWRAVLFDFDGTLADSYPAIAASVNHLRVGYRLPPLPEGEVRRFVGRGAAALLRDTIPGGDLEADLAEYARHHPTVMLQGTRLFPGVFDGLTALHRHGLRLAVCSNKPIAFTRELLRHMNLQRVFEAVLGPEEVPRPKPAPDMLLAALAQLKVPVAEALYVGDMRIDVTTARTAGVSVWVLPTGSDSRDELLEARPDRLVESFAELTAALMA